MDRPPHTAPLLVGGRELLLSALTFAALEQRGDDIRRLAQGGFASGQELFDTTLRVVHASIARRCPDVALDWLKGELDWPSAHDAVSTVLRLSFPSAEGEARAASPSGTSTGSS